MKYQRRILLSVTGLNPQVVTETLYALKDNQEEIPTEIHLITTEYGKNAAVESLFGKGNYFQKFCEDYGLVGKILFDPSYIHIIRGLYNETFSDIRTPEQNDCTANFIMQKVKEFCMDENAQVHVSIAGGRKSMGFLIGYALSIFGREQDRLSHVLVSEPFESNKYFFYPTPHDDFISQRDGSQINAKDAEIALADIPFIRLRSGLSSKLLNSDDSFAEVIAEAQKAFASPTFLSFNKERFEITAGNQAIKLNERRFIALYWICQLFVNNGGRKLQLQDLTPESLHAVVKEMYVEGSATYESLVDKKKTDLDTKDFYDTNISRVRTDIQKVLGERFAQPYLVQTEGRLKTYRIWMGIETDKISFGEPLVRKHS